MQPRPEGPPIHISACLQRQAHESHRQISSETKEPVRGIRGFKLRSPYAPAEGYRYDGLYTVEKVGVPQSANISAVAEP